MQAVQYGNLYRFVASLGVVAIAASVTLPWLFTNSLSVLTITQDQLDALAPIARETIVLRQRAISVAQVFIVALALFLFLAGVSALLWAIARWSARQLIEDQRDDVELSVARDAFANAGSSDILAKSVEEAAELADGDLSEPWPAPEGDQSKTEDGAAPHVHTSAPVDGRSGLPEGEPAPGALGPAPGGVEVDANGRELAPISGNRGPNAGGDDPDHGGEHSPVESTGNEPDGDYGYSPDGGVAYRPYGGYGYSPDSGVAYQPDGGHGYDPDSGHGYDPDSGRRYEPDGGLSDERLKNPAYIRAFAAYNRAENRAYELLLSAYGDAFRVTRNARARNSRGTILDFLVDPRFEGAWGPFGVELKLVAREANLANVLRDGMTGLAESTVKFSVQRVYTGATAVMPPARTAGVLILILDAPQSRMDQMYGRVQQLVPSINAALNRPIGVLVLSRRRFDQVAGSELRILIAAALQGEVVPAL